MLKYTPAPVELLKRTQQRRWETLTADTTSRTRLGGYAIDEGDVDGAPLIADGFSKHIGSSYGSGDCSGAFPRCP
jgi:hypothetical protein